MYALPSIVYIDSEITYIAVLTHSLALLHLAGAHKHTLNSSSSEVISEMIKKMIRTVLGWI